MLTKKKCLFFVVVVVVFISGKTVVAETSH